jgi:hypothetical protein
LPEDKTIVYFRKYKNMPELPAGFVGDIVANATLMLGIIGPYLALILSVLVTALVVSIIIHSIKN